jgi:hypothetical protein
MKVAAFGLAAALAVGLASACAANDDNMIAAEQVSGTSVGFVLNGTHSNATLSISGPNGFYAHTFSRAGAVAIDLSQFGSLANGTYNYQLTAASGQPIAVNSALDDGRGTAHRTYAYKPAAKSGTFNVKDGAIVDYGVPARRGRRDRDSQ